MVIQDGETVFEQYYGTTAERYQDIESVTKSVMSTLVGIAVDEGDITGLDATLAELLPQYRDTMTPDVAAATLEQVLTMTAGFTGSLSDPGGDWLSAPDPVKVILSTTQSPPGQQFHYSNGAAHLLTTILETATGTPILAYARQKLLDPLGVDSTPAYQPLADPKNWHQFQEADFAWGIDQTGNNLGFGALKLKPVDMAVFGSLFLNDGAIDGHQVVPVSWVDEATQAHADAGATGPAPRYGYMWWVNEVGWNPGLPGLRVRGPGHPGCTGPRPRHRALRSTPRLRERRRSLQLGALPLRQRDRRPLRESPSSTESRSMVG